MGITIEDFYCLELGTDADYAKARRIDWSECEAIELRALVDAHKLIYRQEQEQDSNYVDRYVLNEIIVMYQENLRRIEIETYFLKAKGNPDRRIEFNAKLSQAKNRRFSEFIQLKKGRAVCPFHDGDNPSAFSVKNERGKCFVCDWSGDIISFVQQKHGLSFMDAVEKLG